MPLRQDDSINIVPVVPCPTMSCLGTKPSTVFSPGGGGCLAREEGQGKAEAFEAEAREANSEALQPGFQQN